MRARISSRSFTGLLSGCLTRVSGSASAAQMTTRTQAATMVLAGAETALPLAVMMALILVAATVAYVMLVRPRLLAAH